MNATCMWKFSEARRDHKLLVAGVTGGWELPMCCVSSISLNNKNPKSDIGVDAVRSEKQNSQTLVPYFY